MKKNHFFRLGLVAFSFGALVSCSDDDPDPVVIPPNESGFLEVDGGGATYPNTVYINLRATEQTPVARDSWDLAFATGSEFKVLINGTTGAMASATGKTDINEVGAGEIADVEASGELVLSFTNLEGILHVDDPSNPLSKPVIEAISATEAENEVYLLSRGASGVDAKALKKIRIIRNGEGYTLQHANADATTFTSVDIAKDTDFNLVYFSFEDGIVSVEPEKDQWDLAWTAGTSSTPYPQAANGILAYFFQDLVYHNTTSNVGVAEVLEADLAYADFAEEDVMGLSFNTSDRLTIGSNWRGGGGPNSSPEVKTDRYYIVKDTESNVYKVRFLSLTKDGERGKPSFEYELVVEG
ncbi:HmuY family protein [Algoriphagus vanfongensis]|uniref:HmuY family protein n=1 Tax=Algoriphagus vanfongensis TaxID=426371 RepID=UPI00041F8590|nr:HmuY family protein [Algoriphagus vanfongensis]